MKRLLLALLLLLLLPHAAAGQDVRERPDAFVRLSDVAPTVLQDMRYYRTYNFVGDSIDGYEAPECWLTRPAAVALKEVQDRLRPMGLSLKVFDCYRPQRAVNHFVRWARDTGDTRMKEAFYPDEPKRTLFSRGYIASRSGHSRGSTVDLTIARLDADPQPPDVPACPGPGGWQSTEGELDMGTGYDCFSDASATSSPQVTPEQRAHRLLLKALMTDHGFRNYSREWWHYTFRREPFPKTYFDVPVE